MAMVLPMQSMFPSRFKDLLRAWQAWRAWRHWESMNCLPSHNLLVQSQWRQQESCLALPGTILHSQKNMGSKPRMDSPHMVWPLGVLGRAGTCILFQPELVSDSLCSCTGLKGQLSWTESRQSQSWHLPRALPQLFPSINMRDPSGKQGLKMKPPLPRDAITTKWCHHLQGKCKRVREVHWRRKT